jgi:hypothetical protein
MRKSVSERAGENFLFIDFIKVPSSSGTFGEFCSGGL